MEDFKIITERNNSVINFSAFDGDKELKIDFQDSDGTFNYDWISVEQVKKLTNHLIASLGEIGENN